MFLDSSSSFDSGRDEITRGGGLSLLNALRTRRFVSGAEGHATNAVISGSGASMMMIAEIKEENAAAASSSLILQAPIRWALWRCRTHARLTGCRRVASVLDDLHLLLSGRLGSVSRIMGSAYILTLQPTFTQGLILGQFSILCLLVVVLKYLFFDPATAQPYKATSYQPRIVREDEEPATASERGVKAEAEGLQGQSEGVESAGWLNIVLHRVRDITVNPNLTFTPTAGLGLVSHEAAG